MAVLITGLGYIGSALAGSLLPDNKWVIGVENYFSTPAHVVKALGVYKRFVLIEGSVTDPDTIERAFSQMPIDAVFHLAAQASTHPEAATPEYTEATNYTGTRLVLEACEAYRVPLVIVASSTRLYARPLPRRITETTPIDPPDVVHLSQLYGEVLLKTLAGRHSSWNPTLVAARLGTVHGSAHVLRSDPRFLAVPQLFCLRAAQGKPLQVQTAPSSVLALIHIHEATEGLVLSSGLPPGLHTVNVAAEVRPVTDIAGVVRDAARARGIDVPIEFTGTPQPEQHRQISSALKPLGFRPRTRIEDSLPMVLDRYLAGFGVAS